MQSWAQSLNVFRFFLFWVNFCNMIFILVIAVVFSFRFQKSFLLLKGFIQYVLQFLFTCLFLSINKKLVYLLIINLKLIYLLIKIWRNYLAGWRSDLTLSQVLLIIIKVDVMIFLDARKLWQSIILYFQRNLLQNIEIRTFRIIIYIFNNVFFIIRNFAIKVIVKRYYQLSLFSLLLLIWFLFFI